MLVWHFFRHFIFSNRSGSLIRRIAWLSVIAITISVSAFLIVLFVMNGMNKSIQERILAIEPHITLTAAKGVESQKIESQKNFTDLKNNTELRAFVFETQDVILRSTEGQFRGAVARGVTEESLNFFLNQIQAMDRKNNPKKYLSVPQTIPEDLPGDSEILIGLDLARALGVYEGDYVTVIPPESLLLPLGEVPKFEKVRIKRVISTNLSDVDAQFIFYQRGSALRAFSQAASKQSGIEMWLNDVSQINSYADRLSTQKEFKVETWMDRNSALFYALKLEKLAIGIFLGLAGLIAGSSILTVLALLMSQKKRDIAILRAIGMSAKKTVETFTKMGMLLSASGVLVGVVFGTSLSFYIEKNPINLLPEIYYDSLIPAYVDMWLVFFVLVLSIVLSFIGSWLPAKTAVEIHPSQALRVKN